MSNPVGELHRLHLFNKTDNVKTFAILLSTARRPPVILVASSVRQGDSTGRFFHLDHWSQMNDRAGSPPDLQHRAIAERHMEKLAARRANPRVVTVREGAVARALREKSAEWTFAVLTAGGAVLTAVLSLLGWGIGSLVLHYTNTKLISDQSIASYVGIIFGTSVALAGSFVAIVLARRAVELSESQSQLAERQLEDAYDNAVVQKALADESMRIADRQSLEAEAAVEAAEEYRLLKGMLITFPAILRKSQRDGVFDRSNDATGTGAQAAHKLATLNGVIAPIVHACQRFLESGAPSAIISLARAIDSSQQHADLKVLHQLVQDQRYFEYATSSLYYDASHLSADLVQSERTPAIDPLVVRDKFLRVLHGIYHFVNQVDDLICLAGRGVSLAAAPLLDHDRRFAGQALPIAELNRHLSLGSDFEILRSRILNRDSIVRLAPALLPALPDSALVGQHKGGIVLGLHESGLFEAITVVRKALLAQSHASAVIRVDASNWESRAEALPHDTVPIFLIADRHDVGICRLAAYLEAHPDKWLMRVALLDQVDTAVDTWTSHKYLSLDAALNAWQSFRALHLVLNEVFDSYPFETRDDFIQRARYKLLHTLRRLVPTPDAPLFKGGSYREDLEMMCDGAATALGLALDTGEAGWTLSEFETLVRGFANQEEGALSDERLGRLYDTYGPGQTQSQNMRDVVAELARTPLLDRPLYAFKPATHGMMEDTRDVTMPNTVLFGIAYCDSDFDVRASPLVGMFSATGAGYSLF